MSRFHLTLNMKLFYVVLCIMVIGLFDPTRARNQRNAESQPHKGTVADCKGTRMILNNQMLEVRCMPRKHLVQLKSEFGYDFFPDMVSVNRCDGLCGNNLSCMPMKTALKSILVKRLDVHSREMSCYNVEVEEHTKCRCGCKVTKEDCNQHQIYIEDDCACKCMNTDEAFECNNLPGMVWNPESCKCTCIKPEEDCSTGLEWIPSLCRCAKVMASDDDF